MVKFKCPGVPLYGMLPEETVSPEGEATFGRQLMIISIVWIVVTVLVGIALVLVRPWLTTVF